MRLAVFSLDPVLGEALGCLLSHSGGFDVAACQTHLGQAPQIAEDEVDVFLVTEDLLDETGMVALRKLREQHGLSLVLFATKKVALQDPGCFDAIVNSPRGTSALYSALRGLEPKAAPRRAPRTRASHSIREQEAAELIRRGLSNRQIAEVMGVSEQSVKNYLRSLMRKHGVSNRLQLGLHLAAVSDNR